MPPKPATYTMAGRYAKAGMGQRVSGSGARDFGVRLGSGRFPSDGVQHAQNVRLEGEWLRWEPPDISGVPSWGIGPYVDQTGMLDSFLRISDGEGVRRFAQRYGPLALCAPHGLPVEHQPLSAYGLKPEDFKNREDYQELRDDFELRDILEGENWGRDLRWIGCDLPIRPRERVSDWLRFASQANAVVSAAAASHNNKRPKRNDLLIVQQDLLGRQPTGSDLFADFWLGKRLRVPKDQQQLSFAHASPLAHLMDWLMMTVNEWLSLGGVVPRLAQTPSGKRTVMLKGGNFGILALQMGYAITATPGLA
mgnify:CR=1 FL=1